MIKDIVIVDNVFDDPSKIIQMANELSFENPNSFRDNWKGVRTKELISVDQEKYSSLLTNSISKSLKQTYGDGYFRIEYDLQAEMYFHKLIKTDVYEDSWRHIDEHSIFAGIVYLNENSNKFKTFGTTILKQNETIEIENVFNRLVLYRADYMHWSNGGFGDDLENARLTLNIFINKISFVV